MYLYCENCGSVTPENIYFCPYCGLSLTQNAKPIPYMPLPQINTTKILLLGIAAIFFAVTGYVAFLGIVFGIITLRKVNRLVSVGYALAGKIRVARVLAKIGMFLGIAVTYLFAIGLVLFVFRR